MYEVAPKPITEVTVDEVARVYTGRPGCGCGCKGNYTANRSAISRVLKLMQESASEVRYLTMGSEYAGVYTLEDEKRYRWVYTKKEAEA